MATLAELLSSALFMRAAVPGLFPTIQRGVTSY